MKLISFFIFLLSVTAVHAGKPMSFQQQKAISAAHCVAQLESEESFRLIGYRELPEANGLKTYNVLLKGARSNWSMSYNVSFSTGSNIINSVSLLAPMAQ